MKLPQSIKFRLNLWFLLFLLIIVLFFSTFSYLMLDRNLFYRTYAPLNISSTLTTISQDAGGNEIKDVQPVTNGDQNFKILTGFSIPKDQISKFTSAAGSKVTIMTPAGLMNFDLAQFIPPNMTDGLEIWFYGRYAPDSTGNYEMMAVAQSKSENLDVIAGYRHVLLIVIPVTLVLGACLGYFLVKRMLKPVEEITRVAGEVGEKHLDRRIEVKTGDELGNLSSTLNQSFDRLEKSFARERQFTADASHELRTPLAVMQSEISLALNEGRTPEEYQKSLENISGDISRMSGLIHNLLYLARADSGAGQINLIQIDLSRLLADMVPEFRLLCKEKQIDFDYDLTPDIFVQGDEISLRELFSNLTQNAVHFTPAGGTIILALSQNQNTAQTSVKDTGVGIPAEHLSHLFERFYRVNQSQADGGAGLGLAICKHIVELHKGQISVESRVGEGSTFTVSLPLVN